MPRQCDDDDVRIVRENGIRPVMENKQKLSAFGRKRWFWFNDEGEKRLESCAWLYSKTAMSSKRKQTKAATQKNTLNLGLAH
jgi:hypothetical protein